MCESTVQYFDLFSEKKGDLSFEFCVRSMYVRTYIHTYISRSERRKQILVYHCASAVADVPCRNPHKIKLIFRRYSIINQIYPNSEVECRWRSR